MKTSMIHYFIQCLTKKYCCFSGRARRKEIWSFYLILIALLAIYGFCILKYNSSSNDFAGNSLATLIISILFFLPISGLSFRRLHDVGMSGLWALPGILLHLLSICVDIMSFNDPRIALSYVVNVTAFVSDYAILCGICALYLFIVDFIISFFFGSQDEENKYGEIPFR